MEKIIWIIHNDREEILDLQRKINSFGSMRGVCMLSVDALKRTINERLEVGAGSLSNPSLILADYGMINGNDDVLKVIKNHPKLAGVPLFFIVNEDESDSEDCYAKGAMVIIARPVTRSSVIRIERAAWQYETTKKYEQILQKQISELESAKEIRRLNAELETRNTFLHKVFGKYFSDDVINVILHEPEGSYVGGNRCETAVMMADLRGFSAFADRMPAEEMTDVLNCYFGAMVEIISKYGGTVIELMGDGILAVFGAPVRKERYCDNAVAAAICMQNEMKNVNEYCIAKGYESLEMGIGIHCGETFVGNVGTEQIMRYNVIGRTVNECARIEGCSVGGQILVSKQVLLKLAADTYIIDLAQILAKGIKEPIDIYEIKGLGSGYDCFPIEDAGDDTCRPEGTVHINLSPINNKIVSDISYKGIIKEFSTRSCVVSVNDNDYNWELFDDVEVRVGENEEIPGFAGVYAKVMGVSFGELKLRFTHVNKEFRKFADSIQNHENNERDIIMENQVQDKIVLVEIGSDEIDKILHGGRNECTLYWAMDKDDLKIVFVSNDKSIRALEFVDYLAEDYSMVNGDDRIAKAVIAGGFLSVLMSENDAVGVVDFFNQKIQSYYKDCMWIYADEYLTDNRDGILNMDCYTKKPVAWAYVKTNDIVPKGHKFRLKSLENESDIVITASDDTYVMIGCRGEIYSIARDKFEKTYIATDEKLDVFEQMLDYLPEVRKFPEDEYISIDLKAHLCYPNAGSGIYATQLTKRTKVFTSHNKGEYFVGRPGDFLAIRRDDLTDMYIVQEEIFYQTYKKE